MTHNGHRLILITYFEHFVLCSNELTSVCRLDYADVHAQMTVR